MTAYSLRVQNESKTPGITMFSVFQSPPGPGNDWIQVAWFVKDINPGNQDTFTWDIAWGFNYATSGSVGQNVVYTGGLITPLAADPTAATDFVSILDYVNDAYTMSIDPTGGGQTKDDHTLYVTETNNLPVPSPVFAAITMYGNIVATAQAGANLTAQAILHPTYYIGAASALAIGQQVDVDTFTKVATLDFSQGTSLVATLEADNTWNVAPAGSRLAQVGR